MGFWDAVRGVCCGLAVAAVALSCSDLGSGGSTSGSDSTETAKTDFAPLMVGNSWVYTIYFLQTSSRMSGVTDSSVRTMEVAGRSDSAWFLSVRDSSFYHRKDFTTDTTDSVVSYCDTCVQTGDSIRCGRLSEYFVSESPRGLPTDTVSTGDTCYLYYREIGQCGAPACSTYFIDAIGMVKLRKSSLGTWPLYTYEVNLVKFNGVDNAVYQYLPQN